MKKILVLLFCVCLLTTGCLSTKKTVDVVQEKKIQAEKISYDTLNEIVNNYAEHTNVDVIDVRSEDEYVEGHIPGAMNIPLNSLDKIIISTSREIIVYGDTSSKSKQAANELITLGYEHVKYIAGIDNWEYDLED